MPVTTTYEDIAVAALGTSIKNRADTLATLETELLEVVLRAIRGLYAVAARVNPEFFGDTEDVTAVGTSWPRPEAAESIFYMEQTVDAVTVEVRVVPMTDREADLSTPAVYRWGRKYFPAGNPNDPDIAEDLTFYFSAIPAAPADITDPLPSSWQEHMNQLLIAETAIYLSLKDRRFDEVEQLKQGRNDWLRLFVQFLQHETANITHRFGEVRQITVEELIPMLAGGG